MRVEPVAGNVGLAYVDGLAGATGWGGANQDIDTGSAKLLPASHAGIGILGTGAGHGDAGPVRLFHGA